MDLAEDGSEDATSSPAKEEAGTITPERTEGETNTTQTTPAEEEACTIPPAPTEKDASTIPPEPTKRVTGTTPPASTETEAVTTPPVPARKETGTTLQQGTNPTQKGTPKRDRPATPCSEISTSDDDDGTEDQGYVSCFSEWLGLNPDSKRMLVDETKMLAQNERNMGNKAIPIFQQVVNEDPELITVACAQVTAARCTMREAMVRFETRFANISYIAGGQGKRNAVKDGGWRKWVCKEWESLCFSFEFMVFLWVYGFPLDVWFSFEFMIFLWVYVCVFPLGWC